MSKITGKEYPISKIFTSEFEYHIPPYQRPYAWEEVQVRALFDDLVDFFRTQPSDENFFLGSIVLVKEDAINKPKSDVIDGQQRLTTLSILLSIIASKIPEGEDRASIKDYLYEPGKKYAGIPAQPRLFLRPKEKDFFRKYIQEVRIEELLSLKIEDPAFDSEAKKHIRQNCEVFSDLIDKTFDVEDEEFERFIGFIVTRCYLICVMTPSHSSAYRIFSVMNSRGLDLLPIDIFKADIIGEIADNLQDKYTEEWEDIELNLTRANFNELFVHIRMIYAKEKLREEITANFPKTVLSKFDSRVAFMEEILKPYSEAYRIIKEGNYKSSSANAGAINNTLKWLNKVFNYDWIPATLAFMVKYKDDTDYLLWFLRKMERLAACLMATGKDVNQRISRYAQILNEMENRKNNSLTSPLSSIELTDEEKKDFIERLGKDIYYMTSRYRNYIVQRLDSFISDGGAEYNEKVFTIEHVLPQTVSDGSEWAKLWPDEEKRNVWLHKIANLVPLAKRVNSAAQNYDFDEKKQKYFMNSRTGTTSYHLTSQVLLIPVWSEEVVEERQNTLLEVFKKNWEL